MDHQDIAKHIAQQIDNRQGQKCEVYVSGWSTARYSATPSKAKYDCEQVVKHLNTLNPGYGCVVEYREGLLEGDFYAVCNIPAKK